MPDRDEWKSVALTPRRLSLASFGDERCSAEDVYRPMRPGTRLGRSLRHRGLRPWERRTSVPPALTRPIVSKLLEGAPGVAVMSGSSNRTLVGVSRGRELRSVLKIGAIGDLGLWNEAKWLGVVTPGLTKPELLSISSDDDVVVLELAAVPGFANARVATMDVVVDICVQLQSHPTPVVHGDLAPWNVVALGRGRVVIDWERAREGAEPLRDLTHFLVQQHSQLRRRRRPEPLLEELVGRDRSGWRCLERLGLDPTDAPAYVREALRPEVRRLTSDPRTQALYHRLDALVD